MSRIFFNYRYPEKAQNLPALAHLSSHKKDRHSGIHKWVELYAATHIQYILALLTYSSLSKNSKQSSPTNIKNHTTTIKALKTSGSTYTPLLTASRSLIKSLLVIFSREANSIFNTP